MRKKFYIFIVLMLVASLVTSISYIIINFKKDKEQEEIFEELENIVISNNIEKNEKEQEDITKSKEDIDLKKLYELNNDFVGWIKIENTSISYPVMQTEKSRKDYYLRRNFYKEYSIMGTPYIAEYCDVKASDNLIIYGHHISNNKMFGELEKYKSKDFYKGHKIINFRTMYENADYEIIAVFKTVVDAGFNYYKFEKASSSKEFDIFIKKCKELSFYEIKETAKYGEKLITLSTCEYSNENSRLVVLAKKLQNRNEECECQK